MVLNFDSFPNVSSYPSWFRGWSQALLFKSLSKITKAFLLPNFGSLVLLLLRPFELRIPGMNIEPQRGGRTKSLKGKPSERGDGTQTRRSKKSDYGSQTRLKDFVALSLSALSTLFANRSDYLCMNLLPICALPKCHSFGRFIFSLCLAVWLRWAGWPGVTWPFCSPRHWPFPSLGRFHLALESFLPIVQVLHPIFMAEICSSSCKSNYFSDSGLPCLRLV